MAVSVELNTFFRAIESQSKDLGLAKLPHVLPSLMQRSYSSGTGARQFDRVFSDIATATAAAATYDLLGNLTSQLDGSTVSFVKVNGIFVINLEEDEADTGKNLLVGAGSNPFAGWSGAGSHQRKIAPGGFDFWFSPIDGLAPVAGTGDILTIDPGSDTIRFALAILGRSA